MKVIMTVIKFFFKIIAILLLIVLFLVGVTAAMLYFSDPRYYTSFIEKTFVQQTGQELKITGGLTFKVGKQLEARLNSSVLTIKTNAGNVKVMTQNLLLGIPWNTLWDRKFEDSLMRADQIIVEVLEEAKVISTYSIFSVATKIKRTARDIELNDLKLMTKQGDLSGQVKITQLEKSLRITGALHAKSWTLDKPVDPKKKVITFEGIKNLEGVMTFMVDVLHTPQGEMHNVEAVIDLGAKTLTIQSSHVNLTAASHRNITNQILLVE